MLPRHFSSNIVFQQGRCTIRCEDVEKIPGRRKNYFIYEASPFALVIAIKDEKVLMIEQYRPAVHVSSLEFPGGKLDPNETPDQAAVREFQEETGYSTNHVISLGSFFTENALTNSKGHAFLTTEIGDLTSQKLDHGEEGVAVHWIPIKDLPTHIRTGRFTDGKSISAWALYLMYKSYHLPLPSPSP